MRWTASKMRLGQRAKVALLDPEKEMTPRLLALGVLPGSVVVLRHVAPLGDPVAYEVGGQILSMRRSDAACMVLEDAPVSGGGDAAPPVGMTAPPTP